MYHMLQYVLLVELNSLTVKLKHITTLMGFVELIFVKKRDYAMENCDLFKVLCGNLITNV